jgi:hypothetical protein
MKIRLWFIRETEKARQYSKVPVGDNCRTVDASDLAWIPLSIVEHTTKRGNEHVVELPDWFAEKEGL